MFEKWLSSWKAQIVLGFGNILLIKIKIKCSTGQNLEIIIFIFLKTLVFDKVFKNYNIIGCFYFWKVLLVITSLLLMITYPSIQFRKIEMTTKNSGGFIRFFPPILHGGMMPGGSQWYKDFHFIATNGFDSKLRYCLHCTSRIYIIYFLLFILLFTIHSRSS